MENLSFRNYGAQSNVKLTDSACLEEASCALGDSIMSGLPLLVQNHFVHQTSRTLNYCELWKQCALKTDRG